MTNQEKAIIYDQLIFESDKLQRENSKLKSQYVGNIPQDVQLVIDRNNARIAVLVGRLESLFQ
jgi:hypothetical protein